jgi:hypothetical protein
LYFYVSIGTVEDTRARRFVMPPGRVLAEQFSGIVRWSKAETRARLVR